MMPAGAGRTVWRPAALAAGTGLSTFVVGRAAESVIIRAVHGNRSELEWLSDAVISMAVAGIAYLTPGFRWAARMIPASRIEGDIYDFFQPTDGTVLAIVADVSGKGIPAWPAP
jgi:hypothetical protein